MKLGHVSRMIIISICIICSMALNASEAKDPGLEKSLISSSSVFNSPDGVPLEMLVKLENGTLEIYDFSLDTWTTIYDARWGKTKHVKTTVNKAGYPEYIIATLEDGSIYSYRGGFLIPIRKADGSSISVTEVVQDSDGGLNYVFAGMSKGSIEMYDCRQSTWKQIYNGELGRSVIDLDLTADKKTGELVNLTAIFDSIGAVGIYDFKADTWKTLHKNNWLSLNNTESSLSASTSSDSDRSYFILGGNKGFELYLTW